MAASMSAASRLINPRNPALQSLVRRQLLHPAAASPALPEALSLNPIHLEKDSANRYSSDSRNRNLESLNMPLDLRCGFGFSSIRIEAARTYVPIEDADYQDLDGDEDDDMDDEDEDDFEIQGYSGSDLDDDDENNGN